MSKTDFKNLMNLRLYVLISQKKWIFDNKSLITFDNLIIQSAFYFMYYLQHEVNYSYILLNIYILNISIYINEIEFLNK